MKRVIILITVSLASGWAGCTHVREHGFDPDRYTGVIRIACVGNSITYGSGIDDRNHNSYPSVLDRMLGPRFEVRNFGVSGATLLKKGDKPYWDEPKFHQVADFGPRLVIIKLGTNDSKPQNWKHQEDFDDDLRAMIEHFRNLETLPFVWVCNPVPVYEDRWGINEETVKGEIIPRIHRVADEMGVETIDLYDRLRDRPKYFHDGIHPNAMGAAMMALRLDQAIQSR